MRGSLLLRPQTSAILRADRGEKLRLAVIFEHRAEGGAAPGAMGGEKDGARRGIMDGHVMRPARPGEEEP